MIGAVPQDRSVEPVLTFMQDVAPVDLFDAAANTLRDLPTAAVQPALASRIAALEAEVRARGAVDPRSAALLRIWSKLRQEAADDLAPPP